MEKCEKATDMGLVNMRVWTCAITLVMCMCSMCMCDHLGANARMCVFDHLGDVHVLYVHVQ